MKDELPNTEAEMPEPSAYFYQWEIDKRKSPYPMGIPVLTYNQAEIYAVARVEEATSALMAERDALRATLEAIEAMHNYEQSVGEAASDLYEASNMARYALKKEY